VPLETYELTRRDHRDQKTAEDIRDSVKKQLAQLDAEGVADPALRDRRQAKRREALGILYSSPTPDWQIMRWRVRLYCGHIVETGRHCEVDEPTRHGSSSMRCPECGMEPDRIVAYEPLGMRAKPPTATRAQPRRKPLTRRSIEKRLEQIEAEAMDLREQLKHFNG
jgi:hypothetical protein